MEELKPCSFCGGGGGETGITWDKWQDDEMYCCVECDCGVSTGMYETVDENELALNLPPRCSMCEVVDETRFIRGLLVQPGEQTSVMANYCPNCGRRLGEQQEEKQ